MADQNWFQTWADAGLITRPDGGAITDANGNGAIDFLGGGATASGLLLVISSSVANDIYHKRVNPRADEKKQLRVARIAMGVAVLFAGYLGINPPGFAGEVVALAFGLGAASFFPILRCRSWSRRCAIPDHTELVAKHAAGEEIA